MTRLLGFALWTVYGSFSACLTHYRFSFSSKPVSWGQAFFIECSYAYAAGLLSPLVIFLARRFPLRGPHQLRNVGFHVGGTFCFSLLVSLVWDVVTQRGAFYGGTFSLAKFLMAMDWAIDFGVLLYWVIVLLHYAVDYYRRYQEGLVETADLNAQLAHAQLQALKMQLHPHFLFNALHAISELIHEDPRAAERMIVGLSQLLRLSLETSSDIEVPLRQEMRFVELYLDIERARFEARLRVEIEIEEGLRDAMVPSLILQPLLENAIKHGISRRTDGGLVLLSAREEAGSLALTVRDNGAGFPKPDSGMTREGVGLKTTRERLEKLYGLNQSLYFVNCPDAGAEVTIRLPYRVKSMEVVNR